MRRRALAPLVIAVLVCLVGCAASLQGKLQQADRSIYSALVAIDDTEQQLYSSHVQCGTAPCISEAAHQRFSGYLASALKGAKTFHLAVAAWKPGQPVPVDVETLSAALRSAAETVTALVPAGSVRDRIALLLNAAAFAVNQAVLLLLPPAQANALMPPVLLGVGH